MDLGPVRSGLATNLSTLPNLRVFDYMPDSVTPPVAVVGFPDEWSFDVAMNRGLDEMPNIPIYLLFGKASDRAAQELLSVYVAARGDASVKAAVEADKTLGGACDDLWVSKATDFRIYPVGSSEYLGCRFLVNIVG